MSISKDTSGRLQAIAVRNIEFFRPQSADIPWELLARGSARYSRDQLEARLDMDYTRVANRIQPPATIGVYSMQRIDEQRFELISVAVESEVEHQLVGRRLLGHALGLAESKAAREVVLEVCASNVRGLDTAQRYGFERLAQVDSNSEALSAALTDAPTEVLRFELTPE